VKKQIVLAAFATLLSLSNAFADGEIIDSCSDFIHRLNLATGPASQASPVTIQGNQCKLVVSEMDFEKERAVVLELKNSLSGRTYHFRGMIDGFSECRSDQHSASAKSNFQEEPAFPGVYHSQELVITNMPEATGLGGAVVTIDDDASGSFACSF
jgi:hypothetical protein